MTFLWAFIRNSAIMRYALAAFALVGAVLAYGVVQRKKGRKDEELKAFREAARRVSRGRQAVMDARNSDSSRVARIERLRASLQRWNPRMPKL